jgi:hypothetical protein
LPASPDELSLVCAGSVTANAITQSTVARHIFERFGKLLATVTIVVNPGGILTPKLSAQKASMSSKYSFAVIDKSGQIRGGNAFPAILPD